MGIGGDNALIRYKIYAGLRALTATTLRPRPRLDYGKFDFVMHDGAPVLLDANRTPGIPPASSDVLHARAAQLADGLEALLYGR